MSDTQDDLKARRAKRLTSTGTSNEVARRGLDLDGLVCVDLGHHWTQTELVVPRRGQLAELPFRVATCSGPCGGQRVDSLTWGGQVVSRHYVMPDWWLEQCRQLDEHDPWARKGEYRRLMLIKAKTPKKQTS